MSEAKVQQSAISNQQLLPACVQLFLISVRRQFFSRQTLICFVLTALACVIVIAWSMGRSPSATRFVEMVLMPVYGSDMLVPTVFGTFLLPIYAVCYGASSIGSEREEQTLIYLLTTPLPRPAIYLVKFCASTVIALAWTMGGLFVLCLLADPAVRQVMERMPIRWLRVSELASDDVAHWGLGAWKLVWPAVLLSSLCYSSLFHALGAVFRRGTIISLAYAFFMELLLGNMPGIVKRVSVSFYYTCMVYESGRELPIKLPMGADLFLPIDGSAAMYVLASVSVGLVAWGTIVFTRREYRDVG
jgi:ABC-type Na+ efflux pump permease subunit